MTEVVELREWTFGHALSGDSPVTRIPVAVPHCATRDIPDVRAGGIGHYRAVASVGNPEGLSTLEFDGVSYRCRVSVNGVSCGGHEGAWDSFAIDVRGLLHAGENVIDVEVDLPDYDPTSDLHYRKLLLGFVPDTMGPFAGIWRGARLRSGDGSELTVPHANREVTLDGSWLVIDGERTFFRGILHWGHYPDKGIPSPTIEEARAELELLLSAGFNAVKFCLWVPPQHYLDLCDELGVLVWLELPLWLPPADPVVEDRVLRQYPLIIDAVAHHPSIVIVSLGCELDQVVSSELLDRAYEIVRARMPHVVICANSGSGECYGGGVGATSDIDDYHFYADVHRLEPLLSRFTTARPALRPWIFGEYNDADTWRDATEFTAASHAWWLSDDYAVNPLRSVHGGFGSDQPIYYQQKILDEEGLAAEIVGLRELSLVQAAASRRLNLELTRRYDRITGYAITTLRDVPITTSGILDDNGIPKADIAALRAVNDDAILVLASTPSRRWVSGGDRLESTDPFNATDGDSYVADIILSDAQGGAGPGVLTVSIEQDGRSLTIDTRNVNCEPWRSGAIASLELALPYERLSRSVSAVLRAQLRRADGRVIENAWPLLIHPRTTDVPFLLHDPGGLFDGWAAPGRIDCADLDQLDAQAKSALVSHLVTTRYDDRIRTLAEQRGLHVFAVDDGTYFTVQRLPFWRENVKRVHRRTWIEDAIPTEWLGEPGVAIASDRCISRHSISAKVAGATPLISRYDARRFTVAEYVFEWSDSAGCRTVYSTLSHGAGSGLQPQSAGNNILGHRLIEAFLTSVQPPRRDHTPDTK